MILLTRCMLVRGNCRILLFSATRTSAASCATANIISRPPCCSHAVPCFECWILSLFSCLKVRTYILGAGCQSLTLQSYRASYSDAYAYISRYVDLCRMQRCIAFLTNWHLWILKRVARCINMGNVRGWSKAYVFMYSFSLLPPLSPETSRMFLTHGKTRVQNRHAILFQDKEVYCCMREKKILTQCICFSYPLNLV